MTRKITVGIMLLAFLVLPAARAQDDTVAYVAEDHTITFEYPADWAFQEDEQKGFLYLQDDNLHLTLYTPAVLDDYLIGNIADPSTLVGLVLAVNDLTEMELETLSISGRSAATFSYYNEADDNSGLLTAIQFQDGRLGLIDAYTPDDLTGRTADVLAVAATFDVPPAPAPVMLVRYNAPWQEAVAELEASGLIAPGGSLVFVQPSAFTAGTGERFQPLAQRLVHQDVIVAGALTFTPSESSAVESCGLVMRFASEGDYVWAGQDSDGDVFAAEFTEGELSNSQSVDLDLNPGQAHHFLLIAEGARLIVYVEGALELDDVRVAERAGSYGIALSSGGGANCAVNNMWAYQLPAAVEPGTCQITSAGGAANKRSGAGVDFAIAGQLAVNTSAVATGQAIGADGLTWWLLEDGTWVREDVVNVQGDCAALPQASPD